ncbi:MAG: hypothetical protein KKF44_04210 [Nanoarchaeota archaeon]|nr:hypothetical protein [Nanoarchaeota archaeon]
MVDSKTTKTGTVKRKIPKFVRQDTHKLKRLKNKSGWRRPKGNHSKLKARKTHAKLVSTGYGSSLESKGKEYKSGLVPVVVFNIEDLMKINKKDEGIIISKKVGLKNKGLLLEKSLEMKIIVLNIPDVAEYVKQLRAKFEKKKEVKEKQKEVKKTKEKASKKEEKESIEDKLSEEEKKKLEKKEIDRLLTKKF